MDKHSIVVTKVLRIFFVIGITFVSIAAIVNKAPFYIPVMLILVGTGMVYFISVRIKALEDKTNGK